MIFKDVRYRAYTARVKKLLAIWKDDSVLDVACGYGRFSEGLNNYLGIDFCEGMIKLARETYPDKVFLQVTDAKEWQPKRKFDVVFQVNSLRSMGLTTAEYFDQFARHARRYIASLEADEFIIKQIYDDKDSA